MLIEKNICIYGVIISTGYGVVTLEGLLIAFISEVFTTQSFSIGLVVNLYQNDTMNLLIGVLLLNPRNPLVKLIGDLLDCFSISTSRKPFVNLFLLS